MLAFMKKPEADSFFVFNAAEMEKLALSKTAEYAANKPFPHIAIDNFLPAGVAETLLAKFPKPDAPFWFDMRERDNQYQQKKQGIGNAARLEGVDPFIQNIMLAFGSYPFINFLEKLTGIEGLLPDPHLHGGGMHQTLPGGKLDVHADFNYLAKLNLYRRLNVLVYLNKNWKEDWGGYLELWDREMKTRVQYIEPKFNRCIVFSTSTYSYHGHPEPLKCPDGVTRKSIAFYYYTRDAGADTTAESHSTLWQERPEI